MARRSTPPYSSEVFALRYLNRGDGFSIVSWAESMVLSGFESDHLNILLGEVAPFNSFEMNELLDQIQRELACPKVLSQTEAIQIASTGHIRRYLRGMSDSTQAMSAVANLCIDEGHESSIYDFYLLHWAATDLREDEIQHYWPDADRQNIETIIRQRCLEWDNEYPLLNWQPFEWQTTQPLPSL